MGNFLVAWEQETAPGNRDIYGIVFDTRGFALGSAFPIANSQQDEGEPTIATDGVGGFWVIYEKRRSSGNYQIAGKRLSSTGTITGSEVAVSYSAKNSTRPAATWNFKAAVIEIVWEHQHAGGDRDIHDRSILSNGALLDWYILTKEYNDERNQDISNRGYTHIIWEHQYSSSDIDIYTRIRKQYRDSDGNLQVTTAVNLRQVTTSNLNEIAPSLASF